MSTPTRRRNDDAVEQFLTTMGTVETEERPYAPKILEGTEAIPSDLADALDGVMEKVVEKRGKQRFYTVYDRYGIPSMVIGERLTQVLQDKDPKTGQKFFFAKPPASAPKSLANPTPKDGPVLVVVNCPFCQKDIGENPYLQGVQAVKDAEDLEWRRDLLLFPHVYARHRSGIPRVFRNKERREELLAFATGGRR